MELEIQIVRDPCREVVKEKLRLFGKDGGTIGRAADNYWALPDPKCYVSGQHCEVEFLDDAFWVRDTSRNGVFINDSTDRVGYGHRVRLGDGDRLRLGFYELVVRLRDHGRLIGGGKHEHGIEAGVARGADQAGRTVSLNAFPLEDLASLEVPVVEPLEAEAVEQLDPLARAASELPLAGASTAAAPPAFPFSDTGSHRLVKIDRARLRELGVLAPEPEERLIANQFRQIKRSLLANAFGKGIPAVANGRLIMMTSALPGEGKTFTTMNLALSMARERKVEILVVDADVAKPHVSSLFKLEKEPGLLEALTDELTDVESMVLRTDVTGLSILPAGRCDEDVATELLASARMEDTVARLGAHNPSRIVLFDSPPLLLTNESRVLATVVGQVVMVVRAGVTPQHAVTEAIGYLSEEKPIGLILNQSRATGPGSYYGYGEYGYGQYGSERNRSTSD